MSKYVKGNECLVPISSFLSLNAAKSSPHCNLFKVLVCRLFSSDFPILSYLLLLIFVSMAFFSNVIANSFRHNLAQSSE